MLREGLIDPFEVSVHPSSSGGCGSCLTETRQQAITETLDERAAAFRQNRAVDEVNELGPPSNRATLVLSHETDRLDDIDDENNNLLSGQPGRRRSRAPSLTARGEVGWKLRGVDHRQAGVL